MRPLPPRRCFAPCVLAALGPLLLLTPFLPVLTTARADDIVRRAQEELRKRNLYFGDIDGAANRGTVGALKRFQERKRLAVTGEPDPETLRSLGIPATHTEGGNAPIQPDPWPEMPVLRSDQASRPPPLAGETVIRDDPAATTAPADSQFGPDVIDREAPSVSEPDAPASSSEPPRASPGAAHVFIENYLRDGSTNNLPAEMAYYAEEVDYFSRGATDQAYIRRDLDHYYRRWPERHYEIIGPVTAAPGPRAGETVVRFQVHYVYRGKARAEGRTNNVFTLRGNAPEDWRIVSMKEQRVR